MLYFEKYVKFKSLWKGNIFWIILLNYHFSYVIFYTKNLKFYMSYEFYGVLHI